MRNTNRMPIPPELEQAWLQQLLREHGQICHERRIQLKAPLIRLRRGSSRLGNWSTEQEEISLSVDFIAGHSWPVVLQVLKHEMAHQLCAQVWHEPQAGHGPSFRRACELLGVDAPFQRAKVDLAEGLEEALREGQQASPESRLHQRIRKLLALAQSDNEHEAALALARASGLLRQHRLDALSLEGENTLVHESINTAQQVIPRHRSMICLLLREYFSVRIISASIYDQHRNVQVKTVELLGRSQDVAIARHCYHFLEERLHTLWQAQRHRFKGMGHLARNSFYLGLLAGFRQVLEEEKKQEKQSTTNKDMQALMRSEARLDSFVGERFPRLRTRQQRGTKVEQHLYAAAMEEGRKLRMPQPISDTSAPVRALPGPRQTRRK